MRILIPILIALFASQPAQATPPQAISVDETLEAIGGGYLFVLRTLTDNMASHSRQQVDVVLIARDIGTNQDMYFWPISRTLDHGPEHVETSDDPRLVTLPLEWSYHAGRIIKTHHGRYPNERKATEQSAVEVLRNRDGALISLQTPHFFYETPEDTPERTSYWLSYAKIRQLLSYSLQNTRSELEPYYLESLDPLTGLDFEPEQDCAFSYFAELSEQTDGPQQAFWAAYVTCESEQTMAPVSMFITLQALR